ncbi:unnamed protein product, partial [Rotaria sp. Silwood2]
LTWDVRVNQEYAEIGVKPTSNLTVQTTQNRIQIKSTDRNHDGVFPSTVYAVYYEPINSDRNDSWILTINDLNLRNRIHSLAASRERILFGFITDQFPMNSTKEIGWHTSSHTVHPYGTWAKKHSGYYCIDDETRRWSGTLAGDDEHYLFTMYLVDVTKNDVIQIDIGKVTNVETNETETIVNVFKNNQMTSIKNYVIPLSIPKKDLYPGKKRV